MPSKRSETADGVALLRHRLKTSYRDGTTDIVREQLDFIACLAGVVAARRI